MGTKQNKINQKHQKNILGNLKSMDSLNIIFSYIYDSNFKYKLFFYSNYFQKISSINLSDYKNKFTYNNYIQFAIIDCLTVRDKKDSEEKIKNLEYRLKKYNFTNENIIQYIQEQIIYYKNMFLNLEITIYTPILELLSKQDIFKSIFILIDIKEEKKNFEDYLVAFEKLNKSKSNYNSLTITINSLNYLTELNININQIKQLKISNNNEKDDFLKQFFLLDCFKNNLLYLDIYNTQNIVISDSFEILNDIKLLETLYLSYFEFKNTFYIKLKNLKYLKLSDCKNISIDENCSVNIKELYLHNNEIVKPKSSLKFPELEKYRNNSIDKSLNLDFSNMKKLKSFEGNAEEFIYLENESLDSLTVRLNKNGGIDFFKIVFEKLLHINVFKSVSISDYSNIKNYDILDNIKGKNNSLIGSLGYYIIDNKDSSISTFLSNLLNKFQNISHISFSINLSSSTIKRSKESSKLEIHENHNSNIVDIFLSMEENQYFKINCKSFERLRVINLFFNCHINNLEKALPIFNNKCKVVFKSLVFFDLNMHSNEINFNILQNIYNNIDKMPILGSFILECFSKKADEKFLLKFIKKLIFKKVLVISINIQKFKYKGWKKYSNDELIKIIPDINFQDFHNLEIYHLEKLE